MDRGEDIVAEFFQSPKNEITIERETMGTS
jgi:hypothetical protein